MVPDPQTVVQMSTLTDQMNLLIVAFFGFGVIAIGTLGATLKWWIPAFFKQQLEAQKNKTTADTVDIERERMLPRLLENNQRLVEAMIANSQASNAAMMQRVQTDVTSSNTLLANTRAVTSVAEQLEEVVQTLDTAIINIQRQEISINEARDESKTAAAYSNKAALAAEETLTLVRRQLSIVIEETKHDTGEIKAISVADKPTETDLREDVA
jgi:hypothetical protein